MKNEESPDCGKLFSYEVFLDEKDDNGYLVQVKDSWRLLDVELEDCQVFKGKARSGDVYQCYKYDGEMVNGTYEVL